MKWYQQPGKIISLEELSSNPLHKQSVQTIPDILSRRWYISCNRDSTELKHFLLNNSYVTVWNSTNRHLELSSLFWTVLLLLCSFELLISTHILSYCLRWKSHAGDTHIVSENELKTKKNLSLLFICWRPRIFPEYIVICLTVELST